MNIIVFVVVKGTFYCTIPCYRYEKSSKGHNSILDKVIPFSNKKFYIQYRLKLSGECIWNVFLLSGVRLKFESCIWVNPEWILC